MQVHHRGVLRRCRPRASCGFVSRPGSTKLAVPHNITFVPLPPKCPELNPQQNVVAVLAAVQCSTMPTHYSITAAMPGTSSRPRTLQIAAFSTSWAAEITASRRAGLAAPAT
jgi:hypothetical protein